MGARASLGRFAASRLKIASAKEIRKFQPAIETPSMLQDTSPQPTMGLISAVPSARAFSALKSMAVEGAAEQVAGRAHQCSSPPA
ncbi:hypothetical protein D3C80_1403720 [compost metagenome]